ncbi:MAG TPA: S41 family peptidase [Planctomycetes bacterium]|nr:S41 family peptidase [Fuerstiella sp.]HIK91325.1 S41 family peptidase [Planctomycetota bacterium]
MRLPSFCLVCCLAATGLMTATPAVALDEPENERERYELMQLFAETFQQIESNYVRDVDRRELMESAIQGMLRHLDQYSSFIPPTDVRRFTQMVEQEFGGIGITVNSPRPGQLIVISPLPGTPAYRAGIRAGDLIVEVEGKSTEGLSLTDAVKKLQGPVGRPVVIKVVHPGEDSEPEEIRLVRQLIKAPTVLGDRYSDKDEWEFMYDDEQKIGYIRLSHFSRFTAQEVKAALDNVFDRKVRGLVIDLRYNPGGLLEAAIEIADMLLEDGNIVSVRGRNVPERSWDAKKRDTYSNIPLAVLVNGFSASASEVLSACLQDNKRAVIIGERTWGKGSVQNIIRMEEGESALKLTTASYHRPSGVNIHRFPDMNVDDEWGVTPDEGYLIKYDRKQRTEWQRYRRAKDVLRPAEDVADDEDATEKEEAFNDTQLIAAIDYLANQLKEPEENE